jgi:hypothetical protein
MIRKATGRQDSSVPASRRETVQPGREVLESKSRKGETTIRMAMFSTTLQCPKSAPVIVLFYPCRSLTRQIKHWLERHGGQLSQISFARSLPEIRRRMRQADTVIVDASSDPALASDAFLQAIVVMGPDATAMYSEQSVEEVERLVRCYGAPFFLGPMNYSEWEAYFQRHVGGTIPLSGPKSSPQPLPQNKEIAPSAYRRRAA